MIDHELKIMLVSLYICIGFKIAHIKFHFFLNLETKWKTVQPHTVTPLRNSEKGFNGEDFERLAKFCATHHE